MADPHRVGHELTYYPGEISLRMADIAIINKIDSATKASIETLEGNINEVNSDALILQTDSEISIDQAELIKGKRVLIVEDGPTLTHGEMEIGAGSVAAERFGAKEIIDPRPFAVGSIQSTYEQYPHLDKVLPAMGYGEQQLRDLEQTIQNTDCDTVIIGTPIDLSRVITIDKPYTRVHYELQELGTPNLKTVISEFIKSNSIS